MNKEISEKMTIAAREFIQSLSREKREQCCFHFHEEERKKIFYTPTNHGGLSLGQLTSSQHRLLYKLLATGLSTAGYVTLANIISHENILDHLENWAVGFERERGRDPLLYFISFFGVPGKDSHWSWRFGGHHISLNYTFMDGLLVSTTPSFFGLDPANSPLLGPHLHRPLGALEDYGRQLFRELSPENSKIALVSMVAPADIVSANRITLNEGDQPIPLPEIWRGYFEGQLGTRVQEIQDLAEKKLGLNADHLKQISFTKKPKGVPYSSLTASNREVFNALVHCYLDRLPSALADSQHSILKHELDSVHFLWAGSNEPGEPHYYRIQGERIFIEYDNTQRDANHIHTVWRDLKFDFGGDSLANHYVNDHKHEEHHH